MGKEIKFQVLIKVADMYNFLLCHAYAGYQGIVGILISVGAFALYLSGFGKGDSFATLLLILMSALFTIIQPLHLYYKAAKQVKLNPVFREPLNYKVNKEGITVGQGEEEGLMLWQDIVKVMETKRSVIIYLSRINAYIFPKRELGEQYETFKNFIKENLEEKCRKLK